MEKHPTTQEQQTNHELLDGLFAPRPTVIGIEGGPCSGKTTLVNELAAVAEADGRQMVVLPEAASRHIEPLIASGTDIAAMAAQDRPAWLALERNILENIIGDITATRDAYKDTDAIIVADRVDLGAYVEPDEYRQILREIGRDKPPMLDLVDQLYYLPSVAREQPARYAALKATNVARYETTEQAAETCRRNLQAVSRHPEFHVLWGGDFGSKLHKAAAAIIRPEIESELKLTGRDSAISNFIHIAERDGRLLATSRIRQSYHVLPANGEASDGRSFRLRQVTTDHDETLYYATIKTGSGVSRTEQQRPLTAAQYDRLQMCPQTGVTLEKQRYEFLERDYTHDPQVTGEAPRLRQWTADWYVHPRQLRYDLETPVADAAEAHAVERDYHWYSRTVRSAAILAIQLANA